jgi:hypothetical protein
MFKFIDAPGGISPTCMSCHLELTRRDAAGAWRNFYHRRTPLQSSKQEKKNSPFHNKKCRQERKVGDTVHDGGVKFFCCGISIVEESAAGISRRQEGFGRKTCPEPRIQSSPVGLNNRYCSTKIQFPHRAPQSDKKQLSMVILCSSHQVEVWMICSHDTLVRSRI